MESSKERRGVELKVYESREKIIDYLAAILAVSLSEEETPLSSSNVAMKDIVVLSKERAAPAKQSRGVMIERGMLVLENMVNQGKIPKGFFFDLASQTKLVGEALEKAVRAVEAEREK